MVILRQSLDPLLAQRLASFLRGEGIVAGIFNPITMMGGYDARRTGSMLIILNERDRERCESLLKEYAALPKPEGIEEDSEELFADLTRLDPSVAVRCAACGGPIAVRGDPEACPACGEPVDVMELIVDQLGPEALSPCYEDSPTAVFDDLIGVPCPGCGYWLEGLGRRGVCPECAGSYDKDVILSKFLADLTEGKFLREPEAEQE